MPGPRPPPTSRRRALALGVLVLLAAWLPLACGPEPEPPATRPDARGYDAEGRAFGRHPPPARRPNLIVILIDTLRADALSAERPERGVMPGLTAWAAPGARFENAIAPAPWTLPSVVSLLTGLLPGEHLQSGAHLPPPDPAPLTAFGEILGTTFGYETTAFVGLPRGETPAQMFLGFQRIEADFHLQGAAPLLERWARERKREQPFFLLLHTYEAHDPYGAANHPFPPERGPLASRADLDALGPDPDPAELTRRLLTESSFRRAVRTPAVSERWMPKIVGYMFDGLRRDPDPALGPALHGAYRAGAAWVDGLLARVLAQLAGLGLGDDTLVAVTSDHGEAFGEHGALQHQRWLYDELLRIPLVVRGPAPFDRPQLVRGQVALHDLLPTFFDWAGFPLPEGLEARSFLPLLQHDGPGRVVVSEEVRSDRITGGRSRALLAAVRTPAWKYIVTHETLDDRLVEELYDLATDGRETTNLLRAGSAPPSLPAEVVAAIEDARARIYEPGRRLLPATPVPAEPRPAPLPAAPR